MLILHSHPKHTTFQNDPPAEPFLPPPNPGPDQSIADVVEDRLIQAGLQSGMIRVSVLDGVVSLTGSVHNRMVKYRAEHLASQVPGVTDVENLLKVESRMTPPRDGTA